MNKPAEHHIHTNTPHTDEAANALTPHHRIEPHRQPLSQAQTTPAIPEYVPAADPAEDEPTEND